MRRPAILAGLALVALGCSESAEQNTFLVRVSSINRGNPLQADVLTYNKADSTYSVPEDIVAAEFTNKVYAPSVVTDPGTFWYDFHLKSYRVTWRRADGGPVSGPGWSLESFGFTAATSAIVPVNGTAQIGILLVPAGMKIVAPFAGLVAGGYMQLIADIDFVGSPAVDENEEVHVQASLSVNFADFADAK